jgi:signal transduction histidine kinase
MFERLNSADQYPGTGMGLAIVRRAVERLGGAVGLESQAGQGARFWIDLPASEPETLPVPSP